MVNPRPDEPLTRLEIDTLRCLAIGHTMKEIAAAEYVSESAVRMRVSRAGIKLGTRGLVATTLKAFILGHFPVRPSDWVARN